MEKERKNCEVCKCAIIVEQFDEHFNKCIKNPLMFLLSDYQKCAVKYCNNSAKITMKKTRDKVIELWNSYGYTNDDLENVKKHIKESPVIIHFYFDKLAQTFETDIKYKNCYEIHKMRDNDGNFRTHIEDFLFNKIYNSVPAKDKVKYGCINIYRSEYGVRSASGYGDSYIVLKENLKDRMSFVYGDSYAKPEYISTFSHFDQILLSLPKLIIDNIVKITKGEKIDYDYYPYIEIQIHGDVIYSRDIDHIVLNKRHIDDENLKFIKDYNFKFYD
jgi:hypothetical protein